MKTDKQPSDNSNLHEIVKNKQPTVEEYKSDLIKRLEGKKYQWDKPIDEMPSDWFHHNEAIQDAIDEIRKGSA